MSEEDIKTNANTSSASDLPFELNDDDEAFGMEDESDEVMEEQFDGLSEEPSSNSDANQKRTTNSVVSVKVSTHNMSMENREEGELRFLVKELSILVFKQVDELLSQGYEYLAHSLYDNILSLCYASKFSERALDRSKFYQHLLDGYYSSGKLEETIDYCKRIGLTGNRMQKIADEASKIHHKFAASIITYRRHVSEASAARQSKTRR